MAVFNYQARTKEGAVQSGKVEAPSEEAASLILQRHGLIVTLLESVSKEAVYARKLPFFGGVSGKDLAIFSRQMSILFSANVPLVTALHTIANQSKNEKLGAAIIEVASDIDSGTTFSQALDKHEDIFSNFYIQMVKGGEAAGKLSEVLGFLAEHTEREYHTFSKLRGAMMYPAFVISAFVVVAIAMMMFVMPKLIEVLLQTGAELPLVTRIIIWISDTMREFWYLIILGGPAALFGISWFFNKTEDGRKARDKYIFYIPVIGGLLRKLYIFRFAESLSMLTKGGVPISRSLQITADIIGNAVYKNIVLDARQRVLRGERISESLKEHSEIPAMVTQMVSVGESAGKLDEILDNISSFYQEEVDTMIDNLTALIEPVLIVIMGAGVGVLVAGIMLPIYNSISQLQ